MKYSTVVLLSLILFCSCDEKDIPDSVEPSIEHRGVYINDFYNGGILGSDTLEGDLLAWVNENDFTDIYLYNIGTVLGAGLDNDLSAFVDKAHHQDPYVRVSFVSAGFGNWFTRIEEYHDGRIDSRPDGIVSEIEFWNGSKSFADDYAPWLDKVNDLKFTPAPGEVAPLNADITRQFYIGKIKNPDLPPSLSIAKELVVNHDEIFLVNYHTDAWHLSGSTSENSIVNRLNLLAQAGMELNKEVNIVILFNIYQMSQSPEIWDYFASTGMDNEFENAFVEWRTEYDSSTVITNKDFLNLKGFAIYRYSDAKDARP